MKTKILFHSLFFVSIFIFSINSIAQSENEIDGISKIYPDSFESTIRSKEHDFLSTLYLDEKYRLYVVNKSDTGASLFFSSTVAGWTDVLDTISASYELRISEEEFFFQNGTAISFARFDEYMNDNKFADGYDHFTYVLTEEGWKINHMDVTLASNETLPEKLETPRNKEALAQLVSDLRESFATQNFSELPFVETNQQLFYINKFNEGVLINSKNVGPAEVSDFVSKSTLRNSEHRVLDGHMAHLTGDLNDDISVLITMLNHDAKWMISSFNINHY